MKAGHTRGGASIITALILAGPRQTWQQQNESQMQGIAAQEITKRGFKDWQSKHGGV